MFKSCFLQANDSFGVLLLVFDQHVSHTAIHQFHVRCARQGPHLLSPLLLAHAHINTRHLLRPNL